MPQISQEILRWWPLALLYLVVAPAAGYAGCRLLPPQRQRALPWTAIEIAIILFAVYALWGAFCYQLLVSTGLGERLYGHNVMVELKPGGDELAQMRVGLLATALAFPFQVWTVVGVLRFGSGTAPYQFGLTTHRAGRNVLLGVLGWLILTPLVLAVFALAEWLQALLVQGGAAGHPFERLAKSAALTPAELVLIVLLALVAAPVLEELIFRGLLQTWFAGRWWGGHAAMGLALTVAFLYSASQASEAADSAGRLLAMAPVLFFVVMVPGFVWVYQARQSPSDAALYGTALVFAAAHSFAWPSPVPLFVLALGLGWLARRTRSLVGPMVLHSLFNGVACVQLILMRSGRG